MLQFGVDNRICRLFRKAMASSKKVPKDKSKHPSPGSIERTYAQEQITAKLRAYYSAMENEGIPERFAELLRRLDEAESGENTGSSKKGRQ